MPNAPAIDFKAMQRRVEAALRALPKKLGAEMVNFSLDAFKKQGWTGSRFEAWQKRKNPTKWGKVKRPNRAILVDTGKLRRSVRITRMNADGVGIGSRLPYARAHNEGLRVGFIQNVKEFQRKQRFAGIASTFGTGRQFTVGASMSIKTRRNLKPKVVKTIVTVKAHKRRINMRLPKRQFMGESPVLTTRLKRLMQADINRAIKG